MSPNLEQGPLEEAAILTRAVENVFRKLIRLLVGQMTLTRLQEMIRIIFIEEAELKLIQDRPGRNIPLTKMALLTGLDTRTLQKVANENKNNRPLYRKGKFLREITPESSILDFWSSNSKYLNHDRLTPLVLDLRGEGPSFESLVKEVHTSRGVTVNSLLERLLESDSVKFDTDLQLVELLNSRHMPFEQKSAAALEVGFFTVSNLVETLVRNIKTKTNMDEAFFQRTNWTSRLDKRNLEKLRQEIREKLSASESEVIQILKKYDEDEISENQVSAGVSMFYFEDEASL